MYSDLSPAQNERLRRAMKAFLDERFDGNVAALARAMNRSQPSVRQFVLGLGGASFATAQKFAAVVHKDVLTILGNPEPQPGEDIKLPSKEKTTPGKDVSFVELLDWYYSSPGLKRAVDEHDFSVADILKLYTELGDRIEKMSAGDIARKLR